MFSYSAKPQHTLELAKCLNDHIAQVCKDDPKRFVGLCTLPMQSPELAVQELRRCINELGLVGAQIGSHINDWNLDAPELDQFWKVSIIYDIFMSKSFKRISPHLVIMNS
jgi:aminocarboxymuconate-semialdehyde decarboxylase